MDKDINLSKDENKIVLLICGDPKTGKKTIVKNWLKNIDYKEIDKGSYRLYTFNHEENNNKEKVLIPCEIRILNSEEFETELKINSNFFKNALGGFVVVNIEDESSFINGEKWKEKLDLMCCLPNKFPLPIFLIINKCDKVNFNEIDQNFQKENNISQYFMENQFFDKHFIANGENVIIGDKIKKADQPFFDMIKVIFNFKDIKEKFIKNEEDLNEINVSDKKKKNCIIF